MSLTLEKVTELLSDLLDDRYTVERYATAHGILLEHIRELQSEARQARQEALKEAAEIARSFGKIEASRLHKSERIAQAIEKLARETE